MGLHEAGDEGCEVECAGVSEGRGTEETAARADALDGLQNYRVSPCGLCRIFEGQLGFVSRAAEGLWCCGSGRHRGEPLARWERMTCRFVPRAVLDATVSGSRGRASAPVDECLDSDKSWVTLLRPAGFGGQA